MKGQVRLEGLLPYDHSYLKIIARFSEVYGTGGEGVLISLKTNEGQISQEEILSKIIRKT